MGLAKWNHTHRHEINQLWFDITYYDTSNPNNISLPMPHHYNHTGSPKLVVVWDLLFVQHNHRKSPNLRLAHDISTVQTVTVNLGLAKTLGHLGHFYTHIVNVQCVHWKFGTSWLSSFPLDIKKASMSCAKCKGSNILFLKPPSSHTSSATLKDVEPSMAGKLFCLLWLHDLALTVGHTPLHLCMELL